MTDAITIPPEPKLADFARSCRVILPVEYGQAADDNGRGAVNWGITQYFLSLINDPRTPDQLTWKDACDLYQRYYWEPYNLGRLVHQSTADYIFGLLINTDPRRIAILAQRSAAVGAFSNLRADGVLGPHSIAALNVVDPSQFRWNFYNYVEGWYKAIADAKARNQKYLQGWRNRNKWLWLYSGEPGDKIPERYDPKYVIDVRPAPPQSTRE